MIFWLNDDADHIIVSRKDCYRCVIFCCCLNLCKNCRCCIYFAVQCCLRYFFSIDCQCLQLGCRIGCTASCCYFQFNLCDTCACLCSCSCCLSTVRQVEFHKGCSNRCEIISIWFHISRLCSDCLGCIKFRPVCSVRWYIDLSCSGIWISHAPTVSCKMSYDLSESLFCCVFKNDVRCCISILGIIVVTPYGRICSTGCIAWNRCASVLDRIQCIWLLICRYALSQVQCIGWNAVTDGDRLLLYSDACCYSNFFSKYICCSVDCYCSCFIISTCSFIFPCYRECYVHDRSILKYCRSGSR